MPKVPDIREVLDEFEENHEVNLRYASYDFCYGYFQQHRGNLCVNMEYSCWVLWGYLASWGMLRGSSELLNLSPAALTKLVEYFEELGKNNDVIWEIDVQDYTDSLKIAHIFGIYNCIAKKLKQQKVSPTSTLVTKIMMGVFGCVPAYDKMFTTAFKKIYTEKNIDKDNRCKFNKFNEQSLHCIYEFYKSNQTELDSIKINVLDFSGNRTSMTYKIAKLIDMYGFTQGLEIANKKKKTNSNNKNI